MTREPLFSETPVARRDLATFRAVCRKPGTASALLTEEIESAGKTLARVLVVDGRCLCKNNGIGNLFGDYVVWFSAAALSGRALFVDWINSAQGTTPLSEKRTIARNWTECVSRADAGHACPRVPKRFDLGAHFAAVGGRAWQWTAQTRAAVMAAQGGAHTESVLISRPRVDPVTCDEIVSRLIGNAGWLTVRVADDTATAMLPHCLGVRAPRGIPAASAASSVPSQPLVSRAFPDAPSLRRLLAFFEKRLRANGHHSAARDVAEAAGGADGALGGTLRRAVPGTLWNSPIVIPRPSPLLRAFSRAKPTAGGELAPRQGARVAQMIRRVHGRLLNASRRELQGMSAIPMTRSSAVSASTQSFTVQSMPGTGVEAIPGEAEVPTIGLLTSCTLHAMLRPRKALARYLAPLLERIGYSSLVTLQVRSGWADDSLYLGSAVARMLSRPPSELLADLPNRPRFHYLHLLEQAEHRKAGLSESSGRRLSIRRRASASHRGGSSDRSGDRSGGSSGDGSSLSGRIDVGSGGRRVRRAVQSRRAAAAAVAAASVPHAANKSTSARWLRSIEELLSARTGATAGAESAPSLPELRWRAITTTPCMAGTSLPPAAADSPCLNPSPRYLAARAGQLILRGASDRELLAWRAANEALAFRARVPAPVELAGSGSSRFAQVVRCAAHVAQSVAFERSLQTPGPGPAAKATPHASGSAAEISYGGNAGVEQSNASRWWLYVSSDSPGLRALLERLPALRGHVIGCHPRACSDDAHRAGQWRTPSAAEGLALAADVWMLGASDHSIGASSTTLVHWAHRMPPHDGRPQLLNLMRSFPPPLGNKMVPICPPVPGVGKPGKCVDSEPNYERFPQVVLKPTPSPGPQDECFAKRFSIMSESAAMALEGAL